MSFDPRDLAPWQCGARDISGPDLATIDAAEQTAIFRPHLNEFRICRGYFDRADRAADEVDRNRLPQSSFVGGFPDPGRYREDRLELVRLVGDVTHPNAVLLALGCGRRDILRQC